MSDSKASVGKCPPIVDRSVGLSQSRLKSQEAS